jgi:predicted lipid-binding transport protein (Tim44 family)
MKLFLALLVMALTLASHDVWAKRLGGGASLGKQSSHVAQRSVPPASAPAPVGQSASAKSSAAPTQAPGATSVKNPWGSMLGGLAAGLGLAWLASSLGWGEAFGSLLLVLLVATAAVAVVGWFMRGRRRVGAGQTEGLAYQAASEAVTPRTYSPQNVGNDASARPWERNTTGFDASRMAESSPPVTHGSMIGSALPGESQWGVPVGFDVNGFLRASKDNFRALQAAWDRADVASLRAMMTDDMLSQIKVQLTEREREAPGAVNVTEVVMLEALLLGIEDADGEYMASVEFSGLLREAAAAGPNPFREVWNITRSKAGSGGWLVAGVQALQ